MIAALALYLALAAPQNAAPATPPAATLTPGFPAPRPNPNAAGVYHLAPGVVAPKLISQAPPEYSEEARKKKIRGTVLVSLVVDADGNTTQVQIVRSIADTASPKDLEAAKSLDQKAIEAVSQYRFSPGSYQGKAVPVEMKAEITFNIR